MCFKTGRLCFTPMLMYDLKPQPVGNNETSSLPPGAFRLTVESSNQAKLYTSQGFVSCVLISFALLLIIERRFAAHSMSESDGLQKLTAYLNQTRRQAEAAIDTLNLQIKDLQNENELYAQLCKKLEQEKDYFKNVAESSKNGGTMKQALQERDDWRALIDSVQKDRARLQEQCCALESALDAANAEVIALSEELESITATNAAASATADSAQGSPGVNRSASLSPSRAQRPQLSVLCDEDESTLPSPMTSPILDRNGQELSFNMSGPPNAVIRQLQAELKRAFAQITTERQQAEADRLSYQMEISRLQQELGYKNHAQTQNGHNLPSSKDAGNMQLVPHPATHPSMAVARQTSTIEWLNPLGYIGYWFGGPQSSGSDRSKGAVIIKV